MQIKFHEEAKQKGIHIVSACGFDSIPADMGLEILREKFPGNWFDCWVNSTKRLTSNEIH